jgi:3-oxoacyl-[acyl-carrier protein] reductase
MPNNLKGKVAIVTGSGQGVGKAIAVAIGKEGAKVVTNNRQPGSTGASTYGEDFFRKLPEDQQQWMTKMDAQLSGDAETTANEITKAGGQAFPFYGDVADFDVARKLVEAAVNKYGRVDILVTAAGTFRHRLIWEMSKDDWDVVIRPHVDGTFNCVRHVAPLMKDQKWGRIINTTSGSWLGVLEHSNYAAAKGAIVGFTRAIARDLYPYNVTCNAYAPFAMTRSVYNMVVRAREAARMGAPIMTPAQLADAEKIPGAEGIGPCIAYLATEQASNISGTVFSCRGSYFGIYSEPEIKKSVTKEGIWTVDELIKEVPRVLLQGYKNPATPRG